MTTTNELDGKECCAKVWSDVRYRELPCGNRAKVIHDDKPYCGIHDPEKKKARRERAHAKWEAEGRLGTAKAAERRAKERIADAVIGGALDLATGMLLSEYRKAEAEHKAARRALAEIESGA